MTSPNIVNVTTITGKSNFAVLTTSATTLVENTAGSNKVFKINSLLISNKHASTTNTATVNIVRSATSYTLINTVSIPPSTTVVPIVKDSSIYLEEGDSLTVTGSVTTSLTAIISYEEIS